MYRPEIRIVDCTIRDGGLMNDHRFSTELVRKVFDACAKAGVDYCELGYRGDKRQFSASDFGPWKVCDEEDLRSVAYGCDTKVSGKAAVGRTDVNEHTPAQTSIVSIDRVST